MRFRIRQEVLSNSRNLFWIRFSSHSTLEEERILNLVLEAAYSLMEREVVYEFREEFCSPPERLNCYLLVWWAFEESAGIYMPKTMLEQLYRGDPVGVSDIDDVGLIFTNSDWGSYHDEDRAKEGVGHVGILTNNKTVIHACGQRRRIAEDSLRKFLSKRELRGMFRISL
jgi:cell wall-associated NlpC family hydrolase